MTDFVVKHKLNSIKDKIPQSSELENGEIAINDNKGNEALFIKNNEGEIVTFKSKESIDSELEPIIEDIYRILNPYPKNGFTIVTNEDCVVKFNNGLSDSVNTIANEPLFIDWNEKFRTDYLFSIGILQNSNTDKIISIDFSTLNVKFTKLGEYDKQDGGVPRYGAGMFRGCSGLTELDLSSFDTSEVTDVCGLFYNCTNLTTLYLDNFDMSNLSDSIIPGRKCAFAMFGNCNSLNYIRCKQAFKDWCLAYKGVIGLPEAMQEGGSGIWEIID